MRYVAGIDGGQSGTQAAIADESGRVLAHGSAGPADENWQGASSTKMRDALAAALGEARRNAKLDAGVHFEAIVAGVSGYEGRRYGAAPDLPTKRFRLVHDPAIAHAGAFGGASGVVVIAGTGSIAYIVDDDGCSGIVGGLGYVFGDEGSGFWVAKSAIACAIAAGEDSAVASAARNFFGKETLREILAAFYHGELARERFASFARCVLELAATECGDHCARETTEGAQVHLARLAEAASDTRWHWRSRPRAAFVGGLMHDASFRAGVYERLAGPEILEPRYPPVLGAVVLAMQEAGIAAAALT